MHGRELLVQEFRGHLTLALKLYIVVAATERTTTDSFWEKRDEQS
jgi:hypothetical protein